MNGQRSIDSATHSIAVKQLLNGASLRVKSAKRNVQLTNHYNVPNIILLTAEAVHNILNCKVYF